MVFCPPSIRAGGGTMRTKFWQNYFLGKGFAKTSTHLFLNSDVANGKGGVWGGIFHLLLFLFWGNSGRTKNRKYKLGMIYKNYICSIRRDNSIDCFEIKHFQKQNAKRLFVIVDLETFYDKGDKINEEIVVVRESIYNILQKNQGIHIRFINKIMENKSDILLIPEKAEYKKNEYTLMLDELQNMLKKILDEENEILNKINDIERNSNSGGIESDIHKAHEKTQLEKELEKVFILKNEITINIMSVREKMENSILNIDKIMFDNSVMFDTMIKNFALLKDFC